MSLSMRETKTAPYSILKSILLCLALSTPGCINPDRPLSVNRKLADINNDQIEAEVVWPNAEMWSLNLVIGTPFIGHRKELVVSSNGTEKEVTKEDSEIPIQAFKATVTILDEKGLEEGSFNVSPNDSTYCNWLYADNMLEGLILRWGDNPVMKSRIPGKKGTVLMEFQERPTEFDSLWLHYLQRPSQKKLEEGD